MKRIAAGVWYWMKWPVYFAAFIVEMSLMWLFQDFDEDTKDYE